MDTRRTTTKSVGAFHSARQEDGKGASSNSNKFKTILFAATFQVSEGYVLCRVMSQISHNIHVTLQSDLWMRSDISICDLLRENGHYCFSVYMTKPFTIRLYPFKRFMQAFKRFAYPFKKNCIR